MTNSRKLSRRPAAFPTLPKGDVLGTYDGYDEALAVVDRLSRAEFPVKQVSIVGSDLHTVERVTGKMTYGRAALAGAATGVWLGILFGLLQFIFFPTENAFLYLGAAILIGAGFGMLFGIVSHTLNARRRDFTSIHQVIAGKYQVIIDPALTIKAQEVLAKPVED